MTARHVVVIGGGLAGITAAIGLREAGSEVTLLEARPRLGGAASSFSRAHLTIDNGQHVFLRCCTSYQDLLAKLGATGLVTVQDRFDVTVLSPRGQARLKRTGLPGPLHMGRALAGYRLLPLAERAKVARAALALRAVDPADPAADAAALGPWLAARGQSERARRLLWDLFVVSAMNIGGDQANLSLAATVIQTALLGARDAADIGIATVPLGDLHGRAAAALLGTLGVQVRLGARAASIDQAAGGGLAIGLTYDRSGADQNGANDAPAGGSGVRGAAPPGLRSEGATRDGGAPRRPAHRRVPGGRPLGRTMPADGVVLAVPPGQAARLGGAAGVADAGRWDGLGASPIVNVHVVYDRQVTDLPFAAAVESPVQWVFDKTGPSGLAAGQYLAVSLSAADEFVDIPAAALREQFVPALERLFPAAAGAAIADFFVTRERRATFRQAPGAGVLRPGTLTSVPGLVLAGAWTNTGWPDTMEGAVRSGQRAAEEMTRWLTSRPGTSPPGARPPGTSRLGTRPADNRADPPAAVARTGAGS
jgi:monoamine oxidase